VQPWFVSCRNATGFAVTLFVTYLEIDSVKFNDSRAYNVRKLHFQAKLCDVFAENKKQHYCGDLVLGRPVTREDKPLLKSSPLEKCVGHSVKNLGRSQKTLRPTWYPKLIMRLVLGWGFYKRPSSTISN